ncbi:MAG: phosphoribosylglycinamide formyltransferase [Xanthomonadaceae bacterium]|nr:phosphoribosylglycinamide formyltransferase [Xanthomonadaceae bacterium]
MIRIVVLASGQGSNLQALIDACARGQLAASIVGVFSDRASAAALGRAHKAGIPALAMAQADFPSRADFDRALFDRVEAERPDLIVLAGYMRIIDAEIVERNFPRMINLHPSLLPKYPGLRTHARALESGDREHGASIHLVTPELDAGPVLAQARIAVEPGEDADHLEARVRERERPLLVACVDLIARGRLRLTRAGPLLDQHPLTAPLRLSENDQLEPAP